jgi:hypothetical protein
MEMNKKLVENTSKLTASSTIPRIKSLIKPPPSRTSWELLLDDYLKDPNLKSNLTSKPSPNAWHSYQQSTHLSNPIQPIFIPSSYPQYSFYDSYESKSSLPPRRYQMNLDELVYLISQVGRSDLYREMVQYIETQQLQTTSNLSSSHSVHQASNINACSFFLDRKKHKPYFSAQMQDELIKKLTQLKMNRKVQ